MGPFAQDTLAGILGMMTEEQRQKNAAPLGMQPPIDTTQAPGFVGINGQGMTGTALPGLENLSQVPAHDTLMGAAQNGFMPAGAIDSGAAAGGPANPMAAILGMEALKALAAPPPSRGAPGGGAPVAPRGNQVQLSGAPSRLDVAPKRNMSKLMYGG